MMSTRTDNVPHEGRTTPGGAVVRAPVADRARAVRGAGATGLVGLMGLVGLAGLVSLGSISCGQGPERLGLSKPAPATPEELLVELKDHEERIDKATDDMMKRIQEFNASRKPGERTIQFSEIFSQGLSESQRDVLNQMIAEEKDVSYKSLLEKIVDDRSSLQTLQEKVMRLEQSLPDQFAVVKKGDSHHDLAMSYLVNQAQVDPEKSKTLLSQIDLSDELVPGNKVWFFYDQPRDTFRTYVTRGEAGQSPLAVRRALQRKLITERDQAVAARDEAAAARDAAQAEVGNLQQVKTGLETDITGLRRNKADLEANVESLSSDLAFRKNSLLYHAANVRDLKTQGVVTPVRKRLRDVKPVHFDTALDLREKNTITLAPDSFGLERIDRVRLLPPIYQEGRDFSIETSKTSGVAKVTILDPELFKGKEIVLAVGG
jgi:hypothetical protein